MLRRNVLIFHSAALGDFVLTWPLALALARLYPQSRIYYVTQWGKGALAEKVLRIESADVEGGWHLLFAAQPALPEPAMKLLANAHTILSFVAAPGDLWSDNVRRLAPDAHVSFINSSLPENFAGHLSDWLVEQWGGWPAAHAAARQILQSLATRGLPLARSSPGASASSPSSSAILHPGAGSAAKCWPKQKFLELARRLTASGRQVHVLLGEVEAEQWPREEIAGFESVCAVHFPKTCVELLSHLADADVFVGNDSGPSHLAGMIGAPTIALFGPTDPAHWKPLGPRVRVLMGVPDELSVDNVMQAAALV